MDDSNQLQAARTFAVAFAESFAESLTRKLGVPWLLKIHEDADVAPRAEGKVHYRLCAAGGLQGECFVAFEQAQVIAFASKLLEKPVADVNDAQAEALAEVILSAMGGLISTLSGEFGVVNFKVDRVEDVRLEEMIAIPLDISSNDEPESLVLLYLDEPLLGSLFSPGESKSTGKAKTALVDPANLQLVMDVELNVSLRFGQCQLPLRDVLDLTSGSVIELDRDVDDPVELLLDGKVIARGEAVIIDGNYGLRVTEIPEPIASHFAS